MKMENFKSIEVCKILDIPKKRFNQYLERKQIRPSVPAGGSGYKNEFTFGDVLKIRLFQKLIEHGHTLPGASEIAFAPTSKVLTDSLQKAASELIAFKELIAEKTHSGKPLTLLGEASALPERVVWAFFKNESFTRAQMVGEFDEINSVLEGRDIALVIDFTAIAKEVIGLIKTAQGK
jgi:hypothetical protein